MPYRAALSTLAGAADAVAEAARAARDGLGTPPALAALFASPHHDVAAVAAAVREHLPGVPLIGCSGEAVVGNGREVERSPAVALWLADFGPNVRVETFALTAEQTPDGPSLFGWPDRLDEVEPSRALLLALGDPFTFPLTELFLPTLADRYPGLPAAGGMASGASGPGEASLLLNGDVVESGAVLALLDGEPCWRAVVSQGCRAVGKPLVVTRARENVIQELGGRPALEALHALYESLPAADQELLQTGLHVGLAVSEYRDRFGADDFLVRNLYGVDPSSGAVIITDRVRAGQTVRFHLRDADAASDDWRTRLRADRSSHGTAAGALLFTCNGRGTRLFGQPDHDARALAEEHDAPAAAGFFAAGEVGPVGGRNFAHGFTASAVLFG